MPSKGGLLRAWLAENTKILFNPSFGLFKYTENKQSIHPNPSSKSIPDFYRYFEYAGYHVALVNTETLLFLTHYSLIILKAIRTKSYIDVHFSRSFYKLIKSINLTHKKSKVNLYYYIDQDLTLYDLEELDQSLYISSKWILENNVETLEKDFTYEFDILGTRHSIDLIPDGANKSLNEKNKKNFVNLLADMRIRKEVNGQIEAFLRGFSSILSRDSLQIFSPSELSLMIAGAQTIDIDDMKNNTTMLGFTESYTKWFWEVMRELDSNGHSAFLFYISGSSKTAYNGFKEHPIKITKLSNANLLPIAHTW